MLTNKELLLKSLEEQELKIKRQLAHQLQKQEQYFDDNKLFFINLHPKQLAFVENATKKRRVVSAGNRWGKTFVGAAEDASWLIGYRPYFPKGHRLRTLGIPEHGVKILLIVEDWDKAEELFTGDGSNGEKKGYLFDLIPSAFIKGYNRKQSGVIDTIYVESVVNGHIRNSSLHIDTVSSFLRNPMSQESSNWDAIHVDEPMPQAMWKAVSRGLMDRNGSSWWLCTQLSHPWMYNLAVEKWEAQDPDWLLIQGDTDDNPHLTEDAKARYFSELTEVERQCRKSGVPLAHGNLVLFAFNSTKHVWPISRGTPHGWKNCYTPPPEYTIICAIDTHPQTPNAVLFGAVAPTGQVFFFREEWIGGNVNRISEMAKVITETGFNFNYILLEPAGFIVDPETGLSFADRLGDHGLDVLPASKRRTYAIQQTNELFSSDRKVYVMEHCRRTLREIKQWYYNKEDKPVDADDHFMECLGRLVVHDKLTYREPYDQVSTPSDVHYVDDQFVEDELDCNMGDADF